MLFRLTFNYLKVISFIPQFLTIWTVFPSTVPKLIFLFQVQDWKILVQNKIFMRLKNTPKPSFLHCGSQPHMGSGIWVWGSKTAGKGDRVLKTQRPKSIQHQTLKEPASVCCVMCACCIMHVSVLYHACVHAVSCVHHVDSQQPYFWLRSIRTKTPNMALSYHIWPPHTTHDPLTPHMSPSHHTWAHHWMETFQISL